MKRSRIIGTGVLAVGILLGSVGAAFAQGNSYGSSGTSSQPPQIVESAGYTGAFGSCTEGKCADQWHHNRQAQRFARAVEQESAASSTCHPLPAPSCAKCG